jgi:hypothetical protein
VPNVPKSPKLEPDSNFGDFDNFGTGVRPEDWHAMFDERAAIREYDGGLCREDAEVLARQDTIAVLGPCPSDSSEAGA